jgi:hypothetical protein
MSDDAEIKPCIDCGSENVKLMSHFFVHKYYFVECGDCGLTGCNYTDKHKAIESWNEEGT